MYSSVLLGYLYLYGLLIQDKQRRIAELEAQQRLMEASFRTMFRMHREFEALQVLAERSNDLSRNKWAEVAGIGLAADDLKRTRMESASPTFGSELQERWLYIPFGFAHYVLIKLFLFSVLLTRT